MFDEHGNHVLGSVSYTPPRTRAALRPPTHTPHTLLASHQTKMALLADALTEPRAGRSEYYRSKGGSF